MLRIPGIYTGLNSVASAYEDKARGEPLHPSQVQNAVSPLKRQVGASALLRAQALPRGQRKPSTVAKMSTVHRPNWSRGRGLTKTGAQAPPRPGSSDAHPRVVRFVRFLSTEGGALPPV